MIIGIIGTICAGKTEASKHLATQHNFLRLVTRDDVFLEALSRGFKKDQIDRPLMQEIGAELENRFPGYWSRRIISRIKPNTNYVIEGLRYPDQIKIFQALPNFKLLGLNAPEDIRRHRYEVTRNNPGDSDFETADQNDRFKLQKTDACLEMTTKIYNNTGDLSELHSWLDSQINN